MIRQAAVADLPRLLAILNEAIATTTARWTEEPETAERVAATLADADTRGLPLLVAEQAGTVAGFGALAPFRAYPGFRFTIEHSLYVDPVAHRRGTGRALLAALEAQARAAGLHAMVGCITAGNEASLALHSAAGFVEVGRMPEVGVKFGRWLDLVLVQKRL